MDEEPATSAEMEIQQPRARASEPESQGVGPLATGFTQEGMAEENGVTRRVIVYYEAESQYLPTDLLPEIACAVLGGHG